MPASLSLVATLGLNFLLRGLINIGSQGVGIPFPTIMETALFQIFARKIDKFPIQMIWGIAFVAMGWLIFNAHKFGAHVRFVGDNPDSAQEMGISVKRVKVMAYVFVGFGAGLAGVLSVLINRNWFPSTGDGLLLPTLAAVFVGARRPGEALPQSSAALSASSSSASLKPGLSRQG
ncbi:MAG: hypothetical protein M5R40_12405 [Anaerolineae bacterium]|nr:hypothetical protein [Anaerolineae bacterium]